ncbi:hypothetical protein [Nonomuraea rubra]|uniref:DUF4352 domain-containing protein n=1 Tax=Nonomuraea rubra TaxID=46180 RepID=A0A7X0U5X1_9ACTN|nr:hypothetical protein [Nonomuraea rubra]MBB6555945.1 hypothetical protein [Nonomuraea rubra]
MTEPSGGSTDKPRRPVVVPAIALVALAAIGITALLGGLNERPDPAPPQLKPGQVLDQGRFDTQFVESKITLQRAENDFAEDKRFLDVIFKVTNKTDETVNVGGLPSGKSGGWNFGATLLKMTPAIKSETGGDLFVSSHGGQYSQLHPGIPSIVVARYELEGSAQAPEQITYDVGKYKLFENALEDTSEWFLESEQDPLTEEDENTVAAKVTLPVKPEGA